MGGNGTDAIGVGDYEVPVGPWASCNATAISEPHDEQPRRSVGDNRTVCAVSRGQRRTARELR